VRWLPTRARSHPSAPPPPVPPPPVPPLPFLVAQKQFDSKYGPTWHAVVGRNFGSYVTHETKHFIYFYIGAVAVLLFKSG
jgi:hypothetical protein